MANVQIYRPGNVEMSSSFKIRKLLTLVPASTSFRSITELGELSVVHKNGQTLVWMARALVRANEGVWI